jgi:chemotaxis protein CheX
MTPNGSRGRRLPQARGKSMLSLRVGPIMKLANALYFSDATVKVFDTMLSVKVACKEPKVLAEGSPTSDVTGIITFSGDLVGAMLVTFPTATAKAVVKRFASREAGVRDPDFLDAVGELANIIAGQAKNRYDDTNAMISIPSVVCGQDHYVNRRKQCPWVVIGADCELGKFIVAVSIQEKKQ